MPTSSRSMITTMLAAATLTAGFVGGKAARDALFLTSVDVTALPTMLMATSVCSILLVAAQTRLARRVSPLVLVPVSFFLSGLLFVGEWFMRPGAPVATAVLVYLHISGSGPLLASGFWLIVSERFDPRTAKRRFGQIAGAGTFGGLLGALLSERVAALLGGPAMLLCLAAFQFLTAWLVRQLASSGDPAQIAAAARPRAAVAVDEIGGISAHASTIQQSSGPEEKPRSGLRVIFEAPHLHHLAALVLLGTTSAALLEYLFKVKAVETFGPGDHLLRFFALYYAATAFITFVLQTLSSRSVLERFGLGLTASTPSVALIAGSMGSLLAPGFGGLLIARGAESVIRGSWFRAGYELFYTPIPPAEKRAAKSVIDVGLDRLGDAVGGALVRVALVFVPAAQSSTILTLAMVSSAGAILAASHLNRWYVRTLEKSLVKRARGLDLSLEDDKTSTRNVLRGRPEPHEEEPQHVDPEAHDILALRSQQPRRAIEVLSRDEGLAPGLIPYVIPLLAVDALADYALFALRKVVEEHVGQLTDALLDPTRDFAIRRRLARVFSVGVSQRAADGLALALDDERFDVRFQSARSLASILDKNPRVRLDSERIYAVVLREVAVGHPVWESRRLLDGFVSESPLDAFVRDRAGQSLAHVFTLLSLVLPREPLQIAFRSLHAGDRYLRGTALEYLEGVLPPAIRQQLWPFLVYRPVKPTSQAQDEIIADLLRSSASITLKSVAGDWEKDRIAGFGGA